MRRIGRRIRRRIGLGHAGAIGLCGMVSALALAAAAPMAAAQSPAAQSPPAVEDAAPAAASPATPSIEPAAVVAAPPAGGPDTQASAPAAAATPRAAETASQGARSGGTPVRPGQTRYSKRQKGVGAGAAPVEAAAASSTSEVLCRAGCDAQPGSVVFAMAPRAPAAAANAPDADADDDDAPKAQVQAQAKPANPVVTCVAGCFDSAPSFAGVPNAVEGGYALTKSKVPAGKPTSGEWLVRINRERGPEAGK